MIQLLASRLAGGGVAARAGIHPDEGVGDGVERAAAGQAVGDLVDGLAPVVTGSVALGVVPISPSMPASAGLLSERNGVAVS